MENSRIPHLNLKSMDTGIRIGLTPLDARTAELVRLFARNHGNEAGSEAIFNGDFPQRSLETGFLLARSA